MKYSNQPVEQQPQEFTVYEKYWGYKFLRFLAQSESSFKIHKEPQGPRIFHITWCTQKFPLNYGSPQVVFQFCPFKTSWKTQIQFNEHLKLFPSCFNILSDNKCYVHFHCFFFSIVFQFWVFSILFLKLYLHLMHFTCTLKDITSITMYLGRHTGDSAA